MASLPQDIGSKPSTAATSLQQQQIAQRNLHPGLRTPVNRKTIYDRNLNRTRTAELSRASFAYLFAEMVSYAQKKVTGIQDLERRYILLPFPLIFIGLQWQIGTQRNVQGN